MTNDFLKDFRIRSLIVFDRHTITYHGIDFWQKTSKKVCQIFCRTILRPVNVINIFLSFHHFTCGTSKYSAFAQFMRSVYWSSWEYDIFTVAIRSTVTRYFTRGIFTTFRDVFDQAGLVQQLERIHQVVGMNCPMESFESSEFLLCFVHSLNWAAVLPLI